MRYSLLSRFRGCLIGAALGSIYGSDESEELAIWGRMAILGAESLIELGGFDPNDWHQRFCSEFPNLDAVNAAPGVLEKPRPLPPTHNGGRVSASFATPSGFTVAPGGNPHDRADSPGDPASSNFSPLEKFATPGDPASSNFSLPRRETVDTINCSAQGALIVSLPVSLFYHENEIILRQHLLSLAKIWYDEPVSRDGALAIGYAIAQSLQEKLNPFTLIPKTITFLGKSPSRLVEDLAQVQILLQQGSGLERAIQMHRRQAQPSSSIALAFYCFLSNLEDWRLSTLRAARTGEQSQITTTITGALSGAYNSTSGIPAPLRTVLSVSGTEPLTGWGMTTAAQMLELSGNLLAIWSGVYDQAQQSNVLTPVAAIAAPQVMRARHEGTSLPQ